MYTLLIKQFFRLKTVWLSFFILVILGGLGISTGKQFLLQKQESIEKTIAHQQKHMETQIRFHKDDIGLLCYYLKFSFINPVNPLAGLSIGQSDVNSSIQSVSITALEGQKHNIDLVNPMRLQVGNLDFSFLIIFLFPLIIIALNFNILSEEEENGTWKMIRIHSKSSFRFLLTKLSIRFVFVSAILVLLFLVAKVVINIPLNKAFWNILVMSMFYILFWFALCFFVILLRKPSNANAIILLTSWLLLVVFLPVFVSNYINNKLPVDEAFTMVIKQRGAYHEKWDTDKKETLERFYEHYPQLRKYGFKTEGFSWLWYFAMQQMGDDDSSKEREALYSKIKQREALSNKIARWFPPLQLQLSMNEIANTSLGNHVDFLRATTKFHEDVRLDMYPIIFEEQNPDTVNFEKYKPEFFQPKTTFNLWKTALPITLITLILIGFGVVKNLKYFS